MKNFYVLIKGKKKGPLSLAQLKKYKIEAILFGIKTTVITNSVK